VTVGERFDVSLNVQQAGAQLVDGATTALDFDPAALQVVSITAGNALPITFQSTFNNTIGTLDYTAGTFFNFPAGTFTVATVTFSAGPVASTSSLDFHKVPTRQSDVTFGGASVLDGTTNGTVHVVTGQ